MLDRLLDHKADEHFFEEVHAPIFDLCIELLMRNIEKVSQLLGVVEPEKVRKSSRHEHLERDEIAFSKLVMKERENPGKFLLPHGIILLEFGPYRMFMEGNPEGIQNQRPLGIMALSGYYDLSSFNILIREILFEKSPNLLFAFTAGGAIPSEESLGSEHFKGGKRPKEVARIGGK